MARDAFITSTTGMNDCIRNLDCPIDIHVQIPSSATLAKLLARFAEGNRTACGPQSPATLLAQLQRWILCSLSLLVWCTEPLRAEADREPLRWESLLQEIRSRFPLTKQLSTADLADWMGDPTRKPPLLIDVRPEEEFAVSHLHGAKRAETVAAVREWVGENWRIRPLVLYCSVGWRSSALAEQLQQAGFQQVWNLEGSIFRWANEDHPLFQEGRPVREVHPFDFYWGTLLRRDFWPVPSTERPN